MGVLGDHRIGDRLRAKRSALRAETNPTNCWTIAVSFILPFGSAWFVV